MSKGFTLIELVVVTVIIALLAAIGLPQYAISIERGKSTETIKLARDIYDSAQRYAFRNELATSAVTDMEKLDITLVGALSKTSADNDTFTNKEAKFVLSNGTVTATRSTGFFGEYIINISATGSATCKATTGSKALKICSGLSTKIDTSVSNGYTIFDL